MTVKNPCSFFIENPPALIDLEFLADDIVWKADLHGGYMTMLCDPPNIYVFVHFVIQYSPTARYFYFAFFYVLQGVENPTHQEIKDVCVAAGLTIGVEVPVTIFYDCSHFYD